MKRLTHDQAIDKFRQAHADAYDYSRVKYKNSRSKVEIVCPQHGSFWQKPLSHWYGSRCPQCAIEHRAKIQSMDLEYFIARAREKHGGKFDYSEIKHIKNQRSRVTIVCPKHGGFRQSVQSHLSSKHGCPKCGAARPLGWTMKTTERFIADAKEKHGNKYDYSKVDYRGAYEPVIIICPEHGEFKQAPNEHTRGHGCVICSGRYPINQDIFIERGRETFGDYYDYSRVEYVNAHTDVEIICPRHGSFTVKAYHHYYFRIGCPKCGASSGELKIMTYLDEAGIPFEEEATFSDCKHKGSLRFDFFVNSDPPLLIEFDGEQHFRTVKSGFFGGEKGLKERRQRDRIKNEFAIENNFRLVRIPYWRHDNIPHILQRELQGIDLSGVCKSDQKVYVQPSLFED